MRKHLTTSWKVLANNLIESRHKPRATNRVVISARFRSKPPSHTYRHINGKINQKSNKKNEIRPFLKMMQILVHRSACTEESERLLCCVGSTSSSRMFASETEPDSRTFSKRFSSTHVYTTQSTLDLRRNKLLFFLSLESARVYSRGTFFGFIGTQTN